MMNDGSVDEITETGNVKKYGGTIPPFRETKRFVNVIMQDYQNFKQNPDPAIERYNKKVAKMTKKYKDSIDEFGA